MSGQNKDQTQNASQTGALDVVLLSESEYVALYTEIIDPLWSSRTAPGDARAGYEYAAAEVRRIRYEDAVAVVRRLSHELDSSWDTVPPRILNRALIGEVCRREREADLAADLVTESTYADDRESEPEPDRQKSIEQALEFLADAEREERDQPRRDPASEIAHHLHVEMTQKR